MFEKSLFDWLFLESSKKAYRQFRSVNRQLFGKLGNLEINENLSKNNHQIQEDYESKLLNAKLSFIIIQNASLQVLCAS